MKKLILFSFLATTAVMNVPTHAQEKVKFTKEQLKIMDNILFDEIFVGISSKKNSTLILKDGTKKMGSVSGVTRKKGQITSIKMKDATGNKVEYQADEIEEMYLPISGYVKGAKVANYFSNSRNWGSKSLTKSTNPDEVYVKNIKASLKNKKAENEYLMQLINPSFSSQIEVYADPVASMNAEASSVSFTGGPKITGGVIKSYYIKKGEEVIWLKKGEFEENYNFLFGDNQEFLQKFPYNSIKWDYLSYLIAEYTKMTEEKNS
ncbi:MAG: hypothetical protein LBI72_05765 [Flavobacteriaceae bacterium]|jgi:hypothetical protein|nr:hypothetical protein [Flavobacteriaceae bacterium]